MVNCKGDKHRCQWYDMRSWTVGRRSRMNNARSCGSHVYLVPFPDAMYHQRQQTSHSANMYQKNLPLVRSNHQRIQSQMITSKGLYKVETRLPVAYENENLQVRISKKLKRLGFKSYAVPIDVGLKHVMPEDPLKMQYFRMNGADSMEHLGNHQLANFAIVSECGANTLCLDYKRRFGALILLCVS